MEGSDLINGAKTSTSMSTSGDLVGREWSDLLEKVRHGDGLGTVELCKVVSPGIRLYVRKKLGSRDMDDRVHDIFLTLLKGVQRGLVRDPQHLTGFLHAILKRHVALAIQKRSPDYIEEMQIHRRVLAPSAVSPEDIPGFGQQVELIRGVLASLSERQREVLVHFYVNGESPEQICRQLCLTEDELKLIRSRVKTRSGNLGTKKPQRMPERSGLARAS